MSLLLLFPLSRKRTGGSGGEEPLPDPIGMIIDLTEDSAPLPEPVGMTVDLNVTITTP